MKKYSVYILLCTDNSYYTGITNDIDVRLREHQEGYDPKSYTFFRRPVELVFFTELICSFNRFSHSMKYLRAILPFSVLCIILISFAVSIVRAKSVVGLPPLGFSDFSENLTLFFFHGTKETKRRRGDFQSK